MKKFRIDPEVRAALRPLTEEERADLRLSLQTDGCRDPLVVGDVLGDRILADGHNRHDFCTEDRIPFTTIEIKFPTKQLLIEWVRQNQVSRRNLEKSEMASYRRGRRKAEEAKPPGRPSETEEGGEKPSHSETVSGDTAQRIADEEGVSRATIERDAQFAEAVDAIAATEGPEAKEHILNGTSGKTKAEVIASAPILCDRCKRVGGAKNCPACASLREEKAAAKKPEKKPRSGQELFDWHGFYGQFGAVARAPDRIAAAFDGEKQSDEFREAHRLLEEFLKVMKGWQKRLTKSKE